METISDFMEADHDRLDSLFLEFQGAKQCDPGRARELFSEFRSGLLRHIAWEEDILFPRFEERTGMRDSGPTAVMRMEHRKIRELLERIGQGLGGVETREWEEEAHALLAEHNRKEEAILYPWMDRALVESEAREVLGEMAGGPEAP